ncbi:hypothetical protein ACL1HR_08400 [Corynebacterium striatum]|uniref:hypothetical protein n=1 Tax=Corynebacterium striatum TaxID=43770 RepID=UPI00191EEB2F|nr:hypothetical protein [Corynebacterium striatum]EGT5592931.1 hypothetical protein [Corynebacterium striatum]QQU79122.1 hypothetical protein I6I73_10280 [Corynebacterium striatum]
MSDTLFDLGTSDPTDYQDQLETAIAQAIKDGWVSEIDEAALSIARANAKALDQAARDRKYYAIAQISGPYLEVLRSLKLTPESRGEDNNDEANEFLAKLGAATVRDTQAD